jgi:hypothetical protein
MRSTRGLSPGTSDPGRVDDEAARLRVFDEAVVEARVDRIRLGHDRLDVVDDDDPEDAVEELPRGLEASDDVVEALAVREPHEHVTREHRGEDQRPQHPRLSIPGSKIVPILPKST